MYLAVEQSRVVLHGVLIQARAATRSRIDRGLIGPTGKQVETIRVFVPNPLAKRFSELQDIAFAPFEDLGGDKNCPRM